MIFILNSGLVIVVSSFKNASNVCINRPGDVTFYLSLGKGNYTLTIIRSTLILLFYKIAVIKFITKL